MGRRRKTWCRKCALDQPHPFRHWHVWCSYCRRPKIFRGPSCRACHKVGQEIMQEIFGEKDHQ